MSDKRFYRCFFAAFQELNRRGYKFRLQDGLSPELFHSLTENRQETDSRAHSLQELLSIILPENPELINTTWFTREEIEEIESGKTGLPERVMEIFPVPMRDRMALTIGSVSRSPGLLPMETCLELARLLWAELVSMPDPESGNLLDRLVLQAEDRLQRLMEKLGMRVFASFLQHLPEKSCVRLCRRLPSHLAKEVWTVRRRIAEAEKQNIENTWRPNREALEAGFADNPTRSIRRMGGYVLCRALWNAPVTVKQIAQRLQRSIGKDILIFLAKPRHLGAEIESQDALSLLAGEMRVSTDRLKQSCFHQSH